MWIQSTDILKCVSRQTVTCGKRQFICSLANILYSASFNIGPGNRLLKTSSFFLFLFFVFVFLQNRLAMILLTTLSWYKRSSDASLRIPVLSTRCYMTCQSAN